MSRFLTADRPQRIFTRLVILPNKYLVDKKHLLRGAVKYFYLTPFLIYNKLTTEKGESKCQ